MYGLSEIAKIFHLEWDAGYENGWALDKQDLLNVPSGLNEQLGRFPFILGQSWDTRNAASCRLRLNAILMDCVLAEQNLSNANSCPSDFYQPVSLTMESALTVHFLLYGDFTTEVDYSVWSVDHEHMSTHFVVVKAIQENEGYAGLCQCLGYMASVHWIRKKEQLNATVYGCFSDGYDFTLMRIDHDSQISAWTYNGWGGAGTDPGHEKEIYTHLRLIIRSVAQIGIKETTSSANNNNDAVPSTSTKGQLYTLKFRRFTGEESDSDTLSET